MFLSAPTELTEGNAVDQRALINSFRRNVSSIALCVGKGRCVVGSNYNIYLPGIVRQ